MVIRKSLEVDPSKRFQSIREFQSGLTDASTEIKKEEQKLELKEAEFSKPDMHVATVVDKPILPVAEPRKEITRYFDELSADFLSQIGQKSESLPSRVY